MPKGKGKKTGKPSGNKPSAKHKFVVRVRPKGTVAYETHEFTNKQSCDTFVHNYRAGHPTHEVTITKIK